MSPHTCQNGCNNNHWKKLCWGWCRAKVSLDMVDKNVNWKSLDWTTWRFSVLVLHLTSAVLRQTLIQPRGPVPAWRTPNGSLNENNPRRLMCSTALCSVSGTVREGLREWPCYRKCVTEGSLWSFNGSYQAQCLFLLPADQDLKFSAPAPIPCLSAHYHNDHGLKSSSQVPS